MTEESTTDRFDRLIIVNSNLFPAFAYRLRRGRRISSFEFSGK